MKPKLEVLILCVGMLLCVAVGEGVFATAVPTTKLQIVSPLHTTVVPAAGLAGIIPGAQKPQGTYFFMDVNGSYKYGYDSGKGFGGQQSADEANEVTGHYTFHEKGVPYMVRYKAGVDGYQPVMIPTGSAALIANQPLLTQYTQIGNNNAQYAKQLATGTGATATTTTAAAAVQAYVPATPLPSLHVATPVATSNVQQFGGSIQPTLKFVQDIMQQMQRQPVHISFATQQTHLEEASNGGGGTPAATSFAPVTKAEVRQINTLGRTQQQQQQQRAPAAGLPKRPYAFSYQADRSSRTEAADHTGNIVGKYSYYDEAGFHDLSYKAGDDIGFVVLGGSLSAAKANAAATIATTANTLPTNGAAAATFTANAAGAHVPQLVVNVSQEPNINYSYEVQPLPLVATHTVQHSIKARDDRALRKFRRLAK